jgi:hypothetical protein
VFRGTAAGEQRFFEHLSAAMQRLMRYQANRLRALRTPATGRIDSALLLPLDNYQPVAHRGVMADDGRQTRHGGMGFRTVLVTHSSTAANCSAHTFTYGPVHAPLCGF